MGVFADDTTSSLVRYSTPTSPEQKSVRAGRDYTEWLTFHVKYIRPLCFVFLHSIRATWQVRGVRFYASSFSFPARPQLPAPDGSVPCRTSTASSDWQRSPPDLNRQFRSAVFPAGPQQRALVGSVPRQASTTRFGGQCSRVPRRTSTASFGWQCSRRTSTASFGWQRPPPDLNRYAR